MCDSEGNKTVSENEREVKEKVESERRKYRKAALSYIGLMYPSFANTYERVLFKQDEESGKEAGDRYAQKMVRCCNAAYQEEEEEEEQQQEVK
jgi:hypothetical protein